MGNDSESQSTVEQPQHESVDDFKAGPDELRTTEHVEKKSRRDFKEEHQDDFSDISEESKVQRNAIKGMSDGATDMAQTSDNCLSFPYRLLLLLEKDDFSEAIRWNPDGTQFCILPKQFANLVLEPFFQGTRFDTFTRKLNQWGFKRVVDDFFPAGSIVYRNESFQKGKRELLKQLRCTKRGRNDRSQPDNELTSSLATSTPDSVSSFLPRRSSRQISKKAKLATSEFGGKDCKDKCTYLPVQQGHTAGSRSSSAAEKQTDSFDDQRRQLQESADLLAESAILQQKLTKDRYSLLQGQKLNVSASADSASKRLIGKEAERALATERQLESQQLRLQLADRALREQVEKILSMEEAEARRIKLQQEASIQQQRLEAVMQERRLAEERHLAEERRLADILSAEQAIVTENRANSELVRRLQQQRQLDAALLSESRLADALLERDRLQQLQLLEARSANEDLRNLLLQRQSVTGVGVGSGLLGTGGLASSSLSDLGASSRLALLEASAATASPLNVTSLRPSTGLSSLLAQAPSSVAGLRQSTLLTNVASPTNLGATEALSQRDRDLLDLYLLQQQQSRLSSDGTLGRLL